MKNTVEMAEHATMQSFLNCYMRETGNFEEVSLDETDFPVTKKAEKLIKCPLQKQGFTLLIPIRYWSETDRHLLSFPIYYQERNSSSLITLDYITLAALITKELLLESGRTDAEEELLYRVILSCRNMKKYLMERKQDATPLSEKEFTFIEAEQSLLLGHLLHPTPKSKQGVTDEEDDSYSPEMKGEFQLHYFAVEPEIVKQDSAIEQSAEEMIMEALKGDQDVDSQLIKQLENSKNIIIPSHPLQARQLINDPAAKQLIDKGLIKYLGPLGSPNTGTSSFRTVYRRDCPYMYKFSVPVKITNSLRMNQSKELDRGAEVARLWQTSLGTKLMGEFPNFHVIKDPAHLCVNIEGSEASLDVIIRENPFRKHNDKNVSLVAGLCQDVPYYDTNRLASIINSLADSEEQSTEQVSEKWFSKYLTLTLDPLLWLYEKYGIALEAHQQNSIIKLKDGYPEHFYYRDNQGYYFQESKAEKLKKLLPNLNQTSDTICADEIADERFRYYFFFNHLFGLINGFGTSGLIPEEKLTHLLMEKLEDHYEKLTDARPLIDSLLKQEKLPCKANLLTRFHDMDELIGSLATQSVYAFVKNPLGTKGRVTSGL
ncbi:IucA/IucC family protein [Thalassobacillus pellis]|uniref:IucA/IucC family protein n=1 Tax=Thalassobacillus pellis TaxID=748008 RepID=UPI00196184C2|nr:IucA/IucC family protein [Thalassobacillus pellis]MBM7553688.1 siderophore synthetase component [Thalassobacillus pellis]